MKIFLQMLLVLGCAVCLQTGNLSAAPASIQVDGTEATPAYWEHQTKDADKVLLQAKEIQNLNKKIRQVNETVVDLAAYPLRVQGAVVRQEMAASVPAKDTYYTAGKLVPEEDYTAKCQQVTSLQLAGELPVRYAVTVGRTNLRLLPQAEGWFESPEDVHYDDLQGTALDPAEPLAVLADSADDSFVFVQARSYRGWVAKADIAFTERAKWLQYVEPKKFLVVTGNRYELQVGTQRQLFQLGSRIPVANRTGNGWMAILPQAQDGQLKEVFQNIAVVPELHEGYLPYTRHNVLAAAFSLLGDVYGWGGMEDSVDCSSLIQDVYHTVGIELPRDADQQELAFPVRVVLDGMDRAQRLNALNQAAAGDVLFRNGHVMLYLGRNTAGEPRILHSMSSYFTFADGQKEKHYIRQVLVSGVYFENSQGKTNLEVLTSIGSLVSPTK